MAIPVIHGRKSSPRNETPDPIELERSEPGICRAVHGHQKIYIARPVAADAHRGTPTVKILCLFSTDIMPWVIARHWLKALASTGAEVYVGCPPGPYVRQI